MLAKFIRYIIGIEMNGIEKTGVKNNPRIAGIFLFAVFFIAVVLRLWGINFGLPFLYHPDEPNKVQFAQQVLKTGDLNPHYFQKPPFYIYLNALIYIPYLSIDQIRGINLKIQDLQAPQMENMGTGKTSQPSTVLLGRLVTVLFSCLAIWLTFLISQKVTGNIHIAILSTLFMAFAPGLVQHSRFITPDSQVVFFCLLTVFISIDIYQQGRKRDYILAGIAGALAASSKYNAVLVLFVPVVAHLLRNSWRASLKDKKIFWSAIASIITFIVLNPVLLFSFQEFYQGASFEASHYATGHVGMEGNAFIWYLNYFWTSESLAAVLGCAGMFLGLIKRQKQYILLAVFPVVFFAFISLFEVRNDRTAIPITPYTYIFAAILLVGLWQQFAKKSWQDLLIRVVLLCSVIFILLFSLNSDIQVSKSLMTVDSRETSRVWIESNLPAGAKIAIEPYSPYIDPTLHQVLPVNSLINADLKQLKQLGVNYIICSQGMYGRYFNEPEKYAEQVNEYNRLFSTLPQVKTFTDGNYEIKIFQLP
jgi:4-amino-4-deoxy-L-arabinose transferase-like glycosyltransferase